MMRASFSSRSGPSLRWLELSHSVSESSSMDASVPLAPGIMDTNHAGMSGMRPTGMM